MSEQFITTRFGEKLRDLRKAHGISIKELASQLGYASHSYLSEIETGKKLPTIELVLKVSHLFNVSTDQLLKDEVEVVIKKDKQ